MKKTLAVLPLMLISFLLVACGGGGDSSTTVTSVNPAPTPTPIPRECLGIYPFDIFAHTDNQRPQITLIGDDVVTLQIGENYEDAGATARDSEQGDITTQMLVTGLDTIDTSTVGDYLIHYNVQNSSNVTAPEVTRVVRVGDLDDFALQSKRNIDDVSSVYGYIEHLPSTYSNGEPLPLIIYNHGIGEAANFNQVDGDEFANSGDLLDRLLRRGFPGMMRENNWDRSRQFIILSPQRCLDGVVNEALRVNDFLQYALQTYNVDPTRVYMLGFSAGAFVTWVHESAFSQQVAALATIAGGTLDLMDTCAVKDTPSWIFHAADDGTVPSSISTGMFDMLNACTPAPEVPPRLTLFDTGGHLIDVSTLDLSRLNTGNPLYDLYDESIYDWLLTHQKADE